MMKNIPGMLVVVEKETIDQHVIPSQVEIAKCWREVEHDFDWCEQLLLRIKQKLEFLRKNQGRSRSDWETIGENEDYLDSLFSWLKIYEDKTIRFVSEELNYCENGSHI